MTSYGTASLSSFLNRTNRYKESTSSSSQISMPPLSKIKSINLVTTSRLLPRMVDVLMLTLLHAAGARSHKFGRCVNGRLVYSVVWRARRRPWHSLKILVCLRRTWPRISVNLENFWMNMTLITACSVTSTRGCCTSARF